MSIRDRLYKKPKYMSQKRIPTPSQDAGNWGTILNEHIAQTKNPLNGAFNSFDQFLGRPTNLTADDAGRTYLSRQTGNTHEWLGSDWDVKNKSIINVKDYGVTGDGITDESQAIQILLNEHEVLFFPKGDYKVSGVIVPETKRVKLFGDGNIICSGDFGFLRRNQLLPSGNEWARVKYPLYVEGLNFTSNTRECKCIQLDYTFNSGGNYGLNMINSRFDLTNGSIGIALSGAGFCRVSNNYFNMDADVGQLLNPGPTTTAVLTIAGRSYLKSVQTSVFSNNVFWLGVSFDQRYISDSSNPANNTISAIEGWTTTGNFYFASRFNMKMCNTWRAVNEDFVSSHIKIVAARFSQITNCYIDRSSLDVPTTGNPEALMDIRCNELFSTIGLQIANNIFNAQGAAGNFIEFNPPQIQSPGKQIVSITFSNNQYIGSQNIGNNGIVLNTVVTKMYIGGESFYNMTACIKLNAVFGQSVIAPFSAKDCVWWLQNGSTTGQPLEEMFQLSDVDFVYKRIPCTLTLPTYLASGIEEVVGSNTIYFGRMGTRYPMITLVNTTATEANTYPGLDAKTDRSFDFTALKQISAVGGRKMTVTGDVIVDGTKFEFGE